MTGAVGSLLERRVELVSVLTEPNIISFNTNKNDGQNRAVNKTYPTICYSNSGFVSVARKKIILIFRHSTITF